MGFGGRRRAKKAGHARTHQPADQSNQPHKPRRDGSNTTARASSSPQIVSIAPSGTKPPKPGPTIGARNPADTPLEAALELLLRSDSKVRIWCWGSLRCWVLATQRTGVVRTLSRAQGPAQHHPGRHLKPAAQHDPGKSSFIPSHRMYTCSTGKRKPGRQHNSARKRGRKLSPQQLQHAGVTKPRRGQNPSTMRDPADVLSIVGDDDLSDNVDALPPTRMPTQPTDSTELLFKPRCPMLPLLPTVSISGRQHIAVVLPPPSSGTGVLVPMARPRDGTTSARPKTPPSVAGHAKPRGAAAVSSKCTPTITEESTASSDVSVSTSNAPREASRWFGLCDMQNTVATAATGHGAKQGQGRHAWQGEPAVHFKNKLSAGGTISAGEPPHAQPGSQCAPHDGNSSHSQANAPASHNDAGWSTHRHECIAVLHINDSNGTLQSARLARETRLACTVCCLLRQATQASSDPIHCHPPQASCAHHCSATWYLPQCCPW